MEQETNKQATDNLAVIIERLDNFKKDNYEEHQRILEQVQKINGKVAGIDKWRWMIVGALIFVSLTILPIILSLANNYFNK